MCRRSHPLIPAARATFCSPGSPASAMLAQQAALLLFPVLLALVLALVVRLAAAGDGELDLRPAARVEIDGERHERHALAHYRPEHLVHLLGVEEQFARSLRLVVETV